MANLELGRGMMQRGTMARTGGSFSQQIRLIVPVSCHSQPSSSNSYFVNSGKYFADSLHLEDIENDFRDIFELVIICFKRKLISTDVCILIWYFHLPEVPTDRAQWSRPDCGHPSRPSILKSKNATN